MTVPLLRYRAEDVEVLTMAWLAPLRAVGAMFNPKDGLPFTLVTEIPGTENVDMGTADPVVQVDTLCDRGLGKGPAKIEADKTHRAMLYLSRTLTPITLTNGRVVTIDYLNVFKQPSWEPFEDTQILRKCARYTIGLLYTRAPDSG